MTCQYPETMKTGTLLLCNDLQGKGLISSSLHFQSFLIVVFASVDVCVFICTSAFVSVSVCFYVSACMSNFVCLPIYLSGRLNFCLYLFITLSVSLCLAICLCLVVCVFVCVCLSICL